MKWAGVGQAERDVGSESAERVSECDGGDWGKGETFSVSATSQLAGEESAVAEAEGTPRVEADGEGESGLDMVTLAEGEPRPDNAAVGAAMAGGEASSVSVGMSGDGSEGGRSSARGWVQAGDGTK